MGKKVNIKGDSFEFECNLKEINLDDRKELRVLFHRLSNKKHIEEEGVKFSLDSPGLQATTQATEAITNVPVNRVFKKLNNLKNAADNDYAVWQRVLMSLGWSSWDVDPDLAKQKSKDSKKESSKKGGSKPKKTKKQKHGSYAF